MNLSAMPVRPEPLLSVVIPCHHHKDSIGAVIRQWVNCCRSEQISFELVAVNDGAFDGTARILDELRKIISELRVIHQLHEGAHQAVARGCQQARGKFIVQADADGAFRTDDFVRMWEKRDYADFVVGARTHRLDSAIQRSFSVLVRAVARVLFRVTLKDPESPFRLYRRDLLIKYKKFLSFPNSLNVRFAIAVAKDRSERFLEIPIPYRGEPLPSWINWFKGSARLLRELFAYA